MGKYITQAVMQRQGGNLELLGLVVILVVEVEHLNLVNLWVVFLERGREQVITPR